MSISLSSLVDQVKRHPKFNEAGMILCHNGVVRRASREGKLVSGLSIEVDHKRLMEVIQEQKKTEGIIEILVHIFEGQRLGVGDDVMYLVVAGDIRETVLKTLTDTLNLIKSEVTQKTQFYI